LLRGFPKNFDERGSGEVSPGPNVAAKGSIRRCHQPHDVTIPPVAGVMIVANFLLRIVMLLRGVRGMPLGVYPDAA
jgi:hypothetical protein